MMKLKFSVRHKTADSVLAVILYFFIYISLQSSSIYLLFLQAFLTPLKNILFNWFNSFTASYSHEDIFPWLIFCLQMGLLTIMMGSNWLSVSELFLSLVFITEFISSSCKVNRILLSLLSHVRN